MPNPSSGPDLTLAVRLSAPASGLVLRLYTPAFTCVLLRRVEIALPAGWSQVRVASHGLAAGLIYARVQPIKDSTLGKASPVGRLMLTR